MRIKKLEKLTYPFYKADKSLQFKNTPFLSLLLAFRPYAVNDYSMHPQRTQPVKGQWDGICPPTLNLFQNLVDVERGSPEISHSLRKQE